MPTTRGYRRLMLHVVPHTPWQMHEWGFHGCDGEIWRSYIALDLHAGKIITRQHELRDDWKTQAAW